MLPFAKHGQGSSPLVLLHFFGGSQREWTEVCQSLAPQQPCVTVDLPGFGDASELTGYSVEEMAAQVLQTLHSLALESFTLVGHSMSGKVALVLAEQLVPGLKQLILIAPSPLLPEPIPEKNRQEMLAFARCRKDAETYIDSTTAHPLTGPVRERALADFMRTSPRAWTAWLEKGSKEDWSTRVGKIKYPTLVVTGDKDRTLSAPVQKKMTLPFLRDGRLEEISDCGHLPMLETPERLVSLMKEFIKQVF